MDWMLVTSVGRGMNDITFGQHTFTELQLDYSLKFHNYLFTSDFSTFTHNIYHMPTSELKVYAQITDPRNRWYAIHQSWKQQV